MCCIVVSASTHHYHCDRAINTRDRNATERQIDNMYCNIPMDETEHIIPSVNAGGKNEDQYACFSITWLNNSDDKQQECFIMLTGASVKITWCNLWFMVLQNHHLREATPFLDSFTPNNHFGCIACKSVVVLLSPAKQGDNAFGSVRPLVYLFVKGINQSHLCVYVCPFLY